MDGKRNTMVLWDNEAKSLYFYDIHHAASKAYDYQPEVGEIEVWYAKQNWYIHSMAQLKKLSMQFETIRDTLKAIKSYYPQLSVTELAEVTYVSSNEHSTDEAWYFDMSNGSAVLYPKLMDYYPLLPFLNY